MQTTFHGSLPVKDSVGYDLKIERILKIVEYRAKLLSLDAPVQAEMAHEINFMTPPI